VPSFLYLVLRRIFELLVLLCRSGEGKELEILALRHELSVLRRRAGRPRYEDRDRVLLAALSGALPRARWSAFAVTRETLLRWHRRMVKRRGTYDSRSPGRPPLGADLVALVLRAWDTAGASRRASSVRRRSAGDPSAGSRARGAARRAGPPGPG
jgi:hypothetical protein